MEPAHRTADPDQDGLGRPDADEATRLALEDLGVAPDDALGRLLVDCDLAIVDIGARRDVRPELKPLAAFARLFACEPEPAEADRLADALRAALPWRQVTLIPHAIGAREGSGTLYVTARPGMSSLLPPNDAVCGRYQKKAAFEVVATHEVLTIPLDAAAAAHGFQDAAYLKLDTQGTELDILRSGSRLVAESLVAIYVETLFHEFYLGQSLFGDVDAHLRGLGFLLVDMRSTFMRGFGFDPTLYSRHQPAWAHCLYVRDPDTFDAAAGGSLSRLLVLALAYEQHDLALRLVDAHPAAAALRETYGAGLADDVAAFIRRASDRTLATLAPDEAAAALAPSRRC